MKKQNPSPCKQGFTLTELLITVGLIGMVSAISIPGILSGVETSNRRAIFKDTLKTLNEAAEALTNRPEVPTDSYLAMLSAVRTLDKNDTAKTITLHSGAVLSSFNGGCGAGRAETIEVDLNGTRAPNRIFEDIVAVVVSWEPNNITTCGAATATPASFTGGMTKPLVDSWGGGGWTGNEAFYRELTR